MSIKVKNKRDKYADGSQRVAPVSVRRPDFVIRHMSAADNDQVLELCAEVGIVIASHVNLTMLQIDSLCLYVAEDTVNGQILGVCACINLGKEFSFVGEHAVRPKYQGLGIGLSLFRRCLEHAGARRNCGLFADPKMISTYRYRSGFTVIPAARRVLAYSGFPHLFALDKYLDHCDIEWISVRNIIDVIGYDEQVCGLNRAQFLELSISEPDSVSMLARYIESGSVAGYAIFRLTNTNAVQPNPLYADDDRVAEALTYNCLHKFVVPYSELHVETWDVNDGAIYLAAKLGLKLAKRTPIMFTKHDLIANYRRVYFNSPACFYPF